MAVIKAGLIQMSLKGDVETDSPDIIKEKMLAAHMPLIEDAARQGVQVLGLQEIFNIPYVCASHDAKWTRRLDSDELRHQVGLPVGERAMSAKQLMTADIVAVYDAFVAKQKLE